MIEVQPTFECFVLMARNWKGETGFDLLSLETREQLREQFPDLVPDEETLLSDQ